MASSASPEITGDELKLYGLVWACSDWLWGWIQAPRQFHWQVILRVGEIQGSIVVFPANGVLPSLG